VFLGECWVSRCFAKRNNLGFSVLGDLSGF
jgi:hypothetical protein